MKLKIRPYARLITMLGDQLIKNESIALIELIKNCYDADASWVKVSFVDFEEGYQNTNKSKIIIEDDGCGMNFDILVKHWMNPGTPEKLKRKENQSYVTKKGRILQGEKGIGRFAIFKLGSDITIITRRQKSDFNGNFIDKGEDSEFVLRYNFSKYDSDFLTENHEPKELFLDDLNVNLEEITPPDHICEKPFNLAGFINTIRKPYGTRIEITNLKSEWTEKKIKKIKQDTEKLQPIFTDHTTDFNIYFVNGNNNLIFNDSYYDRLTKCFEKAVFKIDNGRYDEQSKQIYFDINGKSEILNFNSPEIKGIKKFQELFNNKQKTECGSFRFMFYIFDLNADPEFSTKNVLDKEEKTIVKNHRIYLYRDGIRVMPYGDPEDDWLGIDIARGTLSAGEYLSNDQVVGCVYISQKENPKLKDKTNREGLIEEGGALSDFVDLLNIILRYIRRKYYAQYLIGKKQKKQFKESKEKRPETILNIAKEQFKDNKSVLDFINKFEFSYKKEKQFWDDRIRKTENLAAVGLSIETASHDLMLFFKRAMDKLDMILTNLSYKNASIDLTKLQNDILSARGGFSLVESQLKSIRLLFPSTKGKTKLIDVEEIINKVESFYHKPFLDHKIYFNVSKIGLSPLKVKATDAVLLQVIINLFDNSFYWLQTIPETDRKILITLNSNEHKLIFSDSGPGVNKEEIPYIFEAFYSGKGEDGRGLGLYIARQLLDRYGYKIYLSEDSLDEILTGANFVIAF